MGDDERELGHDLVATLAGKLDSDLPFHGWGEIRGKASAVV